MFSKLLRNAAINPSAFDTFAFYTRRLKQEESIRRLGLFFIGASLLVQLFAAMVPAEKSLAYSDNHIINGIKTKQDILQAWDRPGSDIPAIYSKFGVTRQDIVNLPNKPNATIKSTASNNYWSIGRNSLSGYTNIDKKYKNQEIAVKTGGPTIYFRQLHAWDTGKSSTYKAFKGRNSTTGKTFWILVDCGNYTQVGKVIKQDEPKKPNIEARKITLGNSKQVKPGGTVKFKIEYRNTVPDSLAEDVTIEDQLDLTNYEFVGPKKMNVNPSGKANYRVGNLKYSKNSKSITVVMRLKKSVPNGVTFCNVATVRSSNAGSKTVGGSPNACVTSLVAQKTTIQTTPTPTPQPTPTPTPTPQPQPVPVPTPTPQPTPTPTPTPQPQPIPETVAPSLSKEVANVTKKVSGDDAIDTTVSAGDVLEYTLTTTNSGEAAISNYTISDYVGDVVDYATIDLGFLSSQGGIYNATSKEIIWQNQSLPPESEVEKVFRVTVKNPIPATNTPSTTSTNFDCKISNEYGEEITLQLHCPAVKTVEALPNTGPGTTIGVAFALTTVSGYFFARVRLLSKESKIIRKLYQHNGIGGAK